MSLSTVTSNPPKQTRAVELQIKDLNDKQLSVAKYVVSIKTDEDKVDALMHCMTSFEFFCDNFCYTLDPRDSVEPHKRFILFDFQREAARQTIDAINSGTNVLQEKSRDMGASWLNMAIITWMWLFRQSFHALIGSRKEDLVDDFTVDSLMGKIDYILQRLPDWMLRGYVAQKHRHKLKIAHPTGNLITGESANPSFGRGPRKNVVYMDEFAFWETDRESWVAVADTAPCKIVTSTPCGEGNQFAKLRFANDSTLIVQTLHWRQHPLKTEDWYQREKAKRAGDDVAIAQELDINYKASAGGLALPQLQRFRRNIIIPPIPGGDPSHENASFYMGLDYGSTNPTSIHVYRVRTIAQDEYEVVSLWEYYQPSSIVQIARAIRGCPYYPLIETIYADPSMWYFNQNTQHGVTSLSELLKGPPNFVNNLRPGHRGDMFALEKLKVMWEDPDNIRFMITEDCPNQIREFEGLRWQTQTSKMMQTRNDPQKLVDKDNHSWDDYKYFFNSRFGAPDIAIQDEGPVDMIKARQTFYKEVGTLKERHLKRLTAKPVRKSLWS